jgi:hypothetical protein
MRENAVEAHDGLLGKVRYGFLESAVGVNDNLCQPVMVAQVDKEHAPMVAPVVEPTAKPDKLADVATAKLAARVRAVAVRFPVLFRIYDKLLTVELKYSTVKKIIKANAKFKTFISTPPKASRSPKAAAPPAP